MPELYQVYQKLLNLHGPQGWWPIGGKYSGKTNLTESDKVEICVGAILAQNTTWKNVERTLSTLQQDNMLSLQAISKVSGKTLSEMILSSGYHNQKSRKLQLFAKHVLAKHGTCSKFLNQPSEILRPELLSLWGIGPETADSIILYAAQKPVFVIDTYTRRIVENLELVPPETPYDLLQQQFEQQLPKNTHLFKEFHALIVKHAKVCCKKNHVVGKNCILSKTFIS